MDNKNIKHAIIKNDIDILNYLLDNGCELRTCDIYDAINSENLEIITILLKRSCPYIIQQDDVSWFFSRFINIVEKQKMELQMYDYNYYNICINIYCKKCPFIICKIAQYLIKMHAPLTIIGADLCHKMMEVDVNNIYWILKNLHICKPDERIICNLISNGKIDLAQQIIWKGYTLVPSMYSYILEFKTFDTYPYHISKSKSIRYLHGVCRDYHKKEHINVISLITNLRFLFMIGCKIDEYTKTKFNLFYRTHQQIIDGHLESKLFMQNIKSILFTFSNQ